MVSKVGKPQPTYTPEFKAKALARLYAEGYPDKRGALKRISKELKVTHQTLARWARGALGAPDPELVSQAVMVMEGVIEGELDGILGEMGDKREKASFRELAIAFGILFDKLQLLKGAPTSRTARVVEDMTVKSDEELQDIVRKGQERANDAVERFREKPIASGSGVSA